MSKRALSRTPRKYVLREDRGEKKYPTFLIHSLTALESAEVQDEIIGEIPFSTDEKGEGTSSAITSKIKPSQMIKSRIKTCELGIDGWEELYDEDDKLLKFSKENIQLLHPEDLEELATEISGGVTEEEEKNSGKQS